VDFKTGTVEAGGLAAAGFGVVVAGFLAAVVFCCEKTGKNKKVQEIKTIILFIING
jgi:hypothetical protein